MTATTGEPTICPGCGSEVAPGDQFCEACGTEIVDASPAAPVGPPPGAEAPIELSRAVAPTQPLDPTPATTPCASCGGTVAPDGYCETCGVRAANPRDHFVETPAGWVAGVCDRGITHHRNEDGMALAADPAPGGRAVLVVCDGVSTSTDSDVASLAGARAARDLLAAHRSAGLGTTESRQAALQRVVVAAAAAANDAVVANSAAATHPDESTASATFAVALLDGPRLVTGGIGDSRVYWLPDDPSRSARTLTTDDSVAQVRIAAGVPRKEAETGPQAHAITRWLGRDAPDVVPVGAAISLRDEGAGWVLVCSDGLWNYVSEAEALRELVVSLDAGTAPLPLAEALVAWACAQGGRDNVTVALARVSAVLPSRPS